MPARLLDLNAQETYFSTIVTRYMQFCAATDSNASLDAAFQALALNEASGPASSTPNTPAPTSGSGKELSTLIMAMRKLREALVATARTDAFAQRALIFITRATLLTAAHEAYYPSLARLLTHIHPRCPLTASERREFVGYFVLDLACRQGALGEAVAARKHWGLKDERVDGVLMALIRDDWVRFWRVVGQMDGYQRVLVKFAEDGMRRHALKCLGRTYHSVEKEFVEWSAARSWAELKRLDAVGWELEGSRVVIRKIKKKE